MNSNPSPDGEGLEIAWKTPIGWAAEMEIRHTSTPSAAAHGVVRQDGGLGQECFCPCLQTPLVIFLESAGPKDDENRQVCGCL